MIVSINRGQNIEEAWENLELAKSSEICVGLDFSGNPEIRKFNDFIEVFSQAREYGLKITVHTGEIQDDEDTLDILNFKPDRLGHCNFLSESCEAMILQHKLPIEICPSSNMATLGIPDMTFHHFGRFHRNNHPISICTDDTLLFDTDLTKELNLVVEAYQLNQNQIIEIIRNSALMAFTPNIIELIKI